MSAEKAPRILSKKTKFTLQDDGTVLVTVKVTIECKLGTLNKVLIKNEWCPDEQTAYDTAQTLLARSAQSLANELIDSYYKNLCSA